MDQIQSARIPLIDQIRGIALLGILIFNIQTYSFFALLRPEQVYQLGLDKPEHYGLLQFLIHVLVKGQFYSIYSFLFGLGFYLMWQKSNDAGLAADRIFKRRLWTLLLFGLVHGMVFWFGDVLHKYAILGFSLIYFNRRPVAVLMRWIFGLVGLMLAIQILKFVMLPVSAQSIAEGNRQFDQVIMQVINAWRTGSVLEVAGFQKLGMLMAWVQGISEGLIGLIHFQLMFLLGLVAGKKEIFRKLKEFAPRLTRWGMLLLPLGLVLKCLSALEVLDVHLVSLDRPALEVFLKNVSVGIGTPVLAVAYLILLGLGLSGKVTRVHQWLANTGKLGLTNYLGQTLLCMVLFYGYGLGLSGRLTLAQTLIPVVMIYLFQMVFSTIWLKFYKLGPIEMLWRWITYR